MSSRLLRRSLLALAAVALAAGACGPGPTPPPPIDDPVTIRVIVDGPGRVTWGPTPLQCYDDCTWRVPGGGDISVNAIPATANVFANWEGDCDTLPNPCRRTFRDGDTITATFARHALRLDLTGDGEGAFSILGGGVSATCSEDCAVPLGQSLLLSITYDAQGSTATSLGDWTGPCEPATVQPNYCLVDVSGATDIGKTWIRPPVAQPAAFTMDWETTLAVPAPGVLADVEDTPGDAHTAELVSGVENGNLTLAADGSFSYTPPLGFSGTDGFTYQARDAFGNLSNVAAVTITIEQINRPPEAEDDEYQVNAGETLTIDAVDGVLANDSDPDGDPLTAILETDVTNGLLDLEEDGSFTYTPNDDFTGDDTFTYRASDGELQSAPATVTITVLEVNQPPVAVDDEYRTTRNTPLIVPAPGVLANDRGDQGALLWAVLAVDAASGSLALDADGSISYSPKPGFTGTDTFAYHAHDGVSESDPANVTIAIASR